mgnify:CR=1 FL=1
MLLLVVVVGLALAFDFTNGFHDTANAVATSVSTRALQPRTAVALAASGNLLGAFLSTAVATTIGTDLLRVEAEAGLRVLAAGCAGAIVWNLITWWMGLPSSSSYALIGGLVGGAIAAHTASVDWSAIGWRVLVPALVAPVLGFGAAFATMAVVHATTRTARPAAANRGFRVAQVGAGGLMAFAHGANDAQKTMGVIGLALVLGGERATFGVPLWVKLAAAAMLALGTYAGGWRIMRTLGARVYRLDPPHGFAAQASATGVLFAAAGAGLPVSSTHVITGAVFGAGSAGRAGRVRWSLGVDILVAWIVTLPAAGLIAALAYIPFALA